MSKHKSTDFTMALMYSLQGFFFKVILNVIPFVLKFGNLHRNLVHLKFHYCINLKMRCTIMTALSHARFYKADISPSV